MNRAILLSGGQDSMALAYWLKPERAITIDYGQAAAGSEIRAARGYATWTGIEHEVITVDCRALGCGEMAGTPVHALSPTQEWWPFRNQLLVTLASMKLVQGGIDEVIIGSVKGDAVHADGTSGFVQNMDALLRIQEGAIRFSAPALHLTSTELMRKSKIPLGVLALAYSCHLGPIPCGKCRGCIKSLEVFSFVEENQHLWGGEEAKKPVQVVLDAVGKNLDL